MRKSTTILATLLFLACVGGVMYFYRSEVFVVRDRLLETYAPCARPITYTLGTFDTRFKISQKTFLEDIAAAEAVWEKPLGRELFKNEDGGSLKINLVYDYRQAATEKLRKLGLVVNDDKASYDALLVKYNALTKDYTVKKAALTKEVASFETEQKTYEAEVAQWNQKGGAPKDVYDHLQAEEARLNMQVVTIQADQDALNATADTTNALVTVINRVAGSLNVVATQFNTIGKERGQEFEEGIYAASPTSTKIDIYEFDTNQKLIRVLAHELGHALGLEHVDVAGAIMYKYNQGDVNKLAPADLAALKAKCGIK